MGKRFGVRVASAQRAIRPSAPGDGRRNAGIFGRSVNSYVNEWADYDLAGRGASDRARQTVQPSRGGPLVRTGEADRSRALLDALPGNSSEASIAHTLYHFVLGDIDSAVERAGQALEQRNFMLISNFLRPFERRLSKSTDWPTVLAKAGLSPALP